MYLRGQISGCRSVVTLRGMGMYQEMCIPSSILIQIETFELLSIINGGMGGKEGGRLAERHRFNS